MRIDVWGFPVDPAFWLTLPHRETPEHVIEKFLNEAQGRVIRRIAVRDVGCWIGLDAQGREQSGYARLSKTKLWVAAYEAVCGAMPEGYVLDHLCHRLNCCNPYHLEPVTPDENAARTALLDHYLKMLEVRDAGGSWSIRSVEKFDAELETFRERYG